MVDRVGGAAPPPTTSVCGAAHRGRRADESRTRLQPRGATPRPVVHQIDYDQDVSPRDVSGFVQNPGQPEIGDHPPPGLASQSVEPMTGHNVVMSRGCFTVSLCMHGP